MRAAEVVAFEPCEHLHIKTRLGRIAGEHDAAVAVAVPPLELVGRLETHGIGVEARERPGGFRHLDISGRPFPGDQQRDAVIL